MSYKLLSKLAVIALAAVAVACSGCATTTGQARQDDLLEELKWASSHDFMTEFDEFGLLSW